MRFDILSVCPVWLWKRKCHSHCTWRKIEISQLFGDKLRTDAPTFSSSMSKWTEHHHRHRHRRHHSADPLQSPGPCARIACARPFALWFDRLARQHRTIQQSPSNIHDVRTDAQNILSRRRRRRLTRLRQCAISKFPSARKVSACVSVRSSSHTKYTITFGSGAAGSSACWRTSGGGGSRAGWRILRNYHYCK